MPASTSNYNLPYPLQGDSDTPYSDIQALAQAVDTRLTTVNSAQAPAWDSSNSLTLRSADVRLTQSARTTILTQTITLSRDQNVLVGAQVRLGADGTSAATGICGITLTIDGVDTLQAGPVDVGIVGNNQERVPINIGTSSVLLLAGSHTIALVGDRDANGVLNAVSHASANSTDYYATRLTIIV